MQTPFCWIDCFLFTSFWHFCQTLCDHKFMYLFWNLLFYPTDYTSGFVPVPWRSMLSLPLWLCSIIWDQEVILPAVFFLFVVSVFAFTFLYFSGSVNNVIGILTGWLWIYKLFLVTQKFHYTNSANPEAWKIFQSFSIFFNLFFQC